MIKTNNLKRESLLLLGEDLVSVMSISKSSLRVFNVTKDKYIQYWYGIENFKGVPIDNELLVELGFKANIKKSSFTLFINARLFEVKEVEGGFWNVKYVGCTIKQIRFIHELQLIISGF